MTDDQSYLIRVPQYVPFDPYSHHIFRFGGLCCEVTFRHPTDEVLWVTPVGDADAPRPDGFEAALLQALEVFYAGFYKTTVDVVRPRLEWNRYGTLNRWRRAPPGQPQTAPVPPAEATPAPRVKRRMPQDSWLSLSTFLQLYLPVAFVCLMMLLTWIRSP
ncbi:hypothetical protein ACQ86G_20090 [Roseateles chitinivorans]|uniref:hypothetical protein n=1 Tax=Roseateles chitinivorans TaxID=2917965 RepID=UPI003D66A18C